VYILLYTYAAGCQVVHYIHYISDALHRCGLVLTATVKFVSLIVEMSNKSKVAEELNVIGRVIKSMQL